MSEDLSVSYITGDYSFYRLLSKIKDGDVIGLDTETTALEPSPDNPKGKIRLIQIAIKGDVIETGQVVYVCDLFKIMECGAATSYNALRDCMGEWARILESERIIKVAHNAKFDLRWLMWEMERNWAYGQVYPKGIFCTYLASILIDAGFDGGKGWNGLASISQRYLGEYVSKEEQTSEWSAPELTQEQIYYAAKDAALMLRLHPEISRRLAEDDLLRVAALEFDACPAIADLENNGIPIDAERWAARLAKNTILRDEAHAKLLAILQSGCDWTEPNPEKAEAKRQLGKKPPAFLKTEITGKKDFPEAKLSEWLEYLKRWEAWQGLPDTVPATVNLGSPTQVAKALNNLGVPVEKTNEKDLDKLMSEWKLKIADLPEGSGDRTELQRRVDTLNLLIDFRGKDKSIVAFGQNFLDAVQGDRRIRTGYRQIGARATGRMSSGGSGLTSDGKKAPSINLQQVPHDDETRLCFKAPEGWLICIVDYGQIEPRIQAFLAQDKVLIEAFRSGKDFYKYCAGMLLSVEYDNVTKDQRSLLKVLALADAYGMGIGSMAVKLGKSYKEAEAIKRQYNATFAASCSFLEGCAAHVVETGWIRTFSGRLLRFPWNVHIEGSKAQAERNAKNAPMQGGSADIIKLALAKMFHAFRGTSARIIQCVHDESVVMFHESERDIIPELHARMMREAAEHFVTGVPIDAEPLVSDCWVKELKGSCCVCGEPLNFKDIESWAFVTGMSAKHVGCTVEEQRT